MNPSSVGLNPSVEYITRVYPPLPDGKRKKWSPPTPRNMGEYLTPPEDWRLLTNEPPIDRLISHK